MRHSLRVTVSRPLTRLLVGIALRTSSSFLLSLSLSLAHFFPSSLIYRPSEVVFLFFFVLFSPSMRSVAESNFY